MGNRQTSNSKETQIAIKHHNLNHSKITILNQQKALKYSPCLDKKQYERWRYALENYQPHSSLFLPLQHTFHPTNLCGSAGTAQVIYPYFPHLLHQEMLNRLNKSQDFSQPEMWYLLFTLLSAKKIAMQAGQMLGDIRPRNILLNQKGRIKIPAYHSWPSQLNKYQKIMANSVTYLSPQQLLAFKDGSLQSKTVTQPAEMFSIGLTLISTANLQDYQNLYDSQNMKFDWKKFENAFSEFILNNKFSQVLRSAVMNLCSFQPGRRMSLLQLFQMLNPYAEQINYKTNFVIYNAPKKLHEEVLTLRTIIAQKTAQYPSQLPQHTYQGLQSDLEPSFGQKLVPSHLNENTSSAYDFE